MKEIKCPKCGTAITVNDADFAELISQVRNEEFNAELDRRVAEVKQLEQEKEARKAAEDAVRHREALSAKDQEIAALQQRIEGWEQNKGLEMEAMRLKAQKAVADAVAKKEDEIRQKEAEINRLSNAERITENVGEAAALLEGGAESEGILADVGALQRRIEALRQFDKTFDETAPMLEDAVCQLKEVFYTVQGYRDGLEFDPERLDELQSRMDAIDKLEKKYGATIEAVLAYREKIENEIESFENYDEIVAALEKKCAEARAEAERRAALLTAARKSSLDLRSSSIRATSKIGRQYINYIVPV